MKKIKHSFLKLKDHFKKNGREIFTTCMEIVGAAAIAIGAGLNWGLGTGLIIAGLEVIILSYLASLVVTE